MFCDRCHDFWDGAKSKAEMSDVVQTCEDVRWQYHELVLYTNINDLKCSSERGCHLCRIIYASPTKREHSEIMGDIEESLDIVLSIDPTKGPHPILSVEFKILSSETAKLPKRMIASCGGLVDDGELVSTLERSAVLENTHTGSDNALELAAFWLKNCTSNHDGCEYTATQYPASFLPTRLLDIGNNTIRLVESNLDIEENTDRRFVALSHCWGLKPIIRTLVSNYEDHRKKIDPELLSKSFKEAVHVARKLGFQYIWIDSLCIKQDDDHDWTTEASMMSAIYQHATLTIAAAHAPSGDTGCFAERDGLLFLPFIIKLQIAMKTIQIQFLSYGGSWDKYYPALFDRAWVLQEELLSRRLLIFEENEIRWQCLTMNGSEQTPTYGLLRSPEYINHISKGIRDDSEYFDQPVTGSTFLSRMKHDYWCSLIKNFTSRGMTKTTDRLIALAGIAEALSRRTKSEYLAGLWSEHFATGLLWNISNRQKLYLRGNAEDHKYIRHQQSIAPSWSWASVTGPVEYPSETIIRHSRICDIIETSVAGRINKQTGRTKIRGHIRRGYVNAIYPHNMHEAATKYPHMTLSPPPPNQTRKYIDFKGRFFFPHLYFLFSEKPPASGSGNTPTDRLITHGNFRLVRGCFYPDQIIDPAQEITFLAITQEHNGVSYPKIRDCWRDDAALRIRSLALVPSKEGTGEYTRIGLAVWDECSWYGFMCGLKSPVDRFVLKKRHLTEDEIWKDSAVGVLANLSRMLWWDDLEYYEKTEEGSHEHGYKDDCLPDLGIYHNSVDVEEKTIVII